ncbi:hypothetical protein MTO96_035070 [Rhipicephalus appendiculatus]
MLLTYRSTPHEVTGCCPSELLLGRRLRNALDLLHPDLRTKVLQKQLKQKIRCDQGTRPRVLGHPGDQVFARNFRPGPAWLPAVVTEQCTSSMHVLLEDGRRLTRHLDHIRQPHEELSADNQKSGSPVATGLAPSLDVGQRQLTPDCLTTQGLGKIPGKTWRGKRNLLSQHPVLLSFVEVPEFDDQYHATHLPRGIKMWNGLPDTIVNIRDPIAFRHELTVLISS